MRSHAILNSDRKLIIGLGSNESMGFVFICSCSLFAPFATLLAKHSSYALDRQGSRYGSPYRSKSVILLFMAVWACIHPDHDPSYSNCETSQNFVWNWNTTPSTWLTYSTSTNDFILLIDDEGVFDRRFGAINEASWTHGLLLCWTKRGYVLSPYG